VRRDSEELGRSFKDFSEKCTFMVGDEGDKTARRSLGQLLDAEAVCSTFLRNVDVYRCVKTSYAARLEKLIWGGCADKEAHSPLSPPPPSSGLELSDADSSRRAVLRTQVFFRYYLHLPRFLPSSHPSRYFYPLPMLPHSVLPSAHAHLLSDSS
jgi:hypothetical protein